MVEKVILQDKNTVYNVYDLAAGVSLGDSVTITNNSDNELFITRQMNQPSIGDGFPILQRSSAVVTGAPSTPIWISGARGSVILQTTVDHILPTNLVDFPSDVWTTKNEGTRRLQVEPSETGFEEGREFRTSFPLSIATSDVVVLKVSAAVDFMIRAQVISSDAEGIIFKAYRASQGVESGVFDEQVGIFASNFMSGTPAYARQNNILTGGVFTPNVDEFPVENVRLRVANATAQATTIGGTIFRQRGLPAGDYYLVFTNYTGTGTALGVYTLEWEERPSS